VPAREQIGIDVSLTENVSQAAGSAGRSVEELRDRIAALNEELNPQKASEYFNSLNQQAQERQQRREQERQLSNVMQFRTLHAVLVDSLQTWVAVGMLWMRERISPGRPEGCCVV
jgi:Sec-independent protein translocase protein TatA